MENICILTRYDPPQLNGLARLTVKCGNRAPESIDISGLQSPINAPENHLRVAIEWAKAHGYTEPLISARFDIFAWVSIPIPELKTAREKLNRLEALKAENKKLTKFWRQHT